MQGCGGCYFTPSGHGISIRADSPAYRTYEILPFIF